MIETRVVYEALHLRERVRRDLRWLRHNLSQHLVGKSTSPIIIQLPDQILDYPPSVWRPLMREWFRPVLVLGKRLFLSAGKQTLKALFEKGYGRWDSRSALALVVSPNTVSIMVAEGGKIKHVTLRKAGARHLKILNELVWAADRFLKSPTNFMPLMDSASKENFERLVVDDYLNGGVL
jgi:hypothetical protein